MQAGQTVTHYKLQKRLGAGGMGEVWLADDTRLQRRVAIKFISPLLGQDRDVQERFLREARAAARLSNHPHVVPVYEFGEAEGSTFIVMDYVEGESLRTVIEREGRDIALVQCLRWAREIADGLSAAHEEGITHRDIKPDNILLDRKGRVRIADFGLARLASSTQLTRTGAGMGTLKYMSPEQATGRNVDHRTDLFSLGATLYELLAGVPAFRGDDPPALVYAVAHTDPEPLARHREDLSPPLLELVEALLRKDPDRRPRSADVVSRALGEILEALSQGRMAPALELDAPAENPTVPLAGTDVAAPAPAGPGPRRRSRLLVLGSGVILLAGVGWVMSQVFHRDDTASVPAGSSRITGSEHRLAILPFAVGSDPATGRYADDVASMLDFVLEGAGDFEVVPIDSVLRYVEKHGLDAGQGDSPRRVVNAFGADRYITGAFRSLGTGIQIEASLCDPDGSVITEARGRTQDEAELQDLVDRIGIQLLEGLFDGPADGIRQAALRTRTDTEALKAFLRGETLDRAGKREEALVAFRKAADLDSTFALALYRISRLNLAITERRTKARDHAARAYRHRSGLPWEYELLLEGWYEESRGNVDRAEHLYRSVLETNRNSSEANARIAALMWDYNPVRGRSPTEAIPYLERRFDIKPDSLDYVLLTFAYFMKADLQSLDRLVRRFTGTYPHALWRYEIACTGDDRELQDAVADTMRLGVDFEYISRTLRVYTAIRIGCYPDNHRNLLAHYARIPDSLRIPTDFLLDNMTRGYVEAGLGSWQKSRRWFDRIPATYALHAAEHEALMMAVPILDVPESEIHDMIERLENWPETDRGLIVDIESIPMATSRFLPHFEIHPHIRLYLLALLHARIGEMETARRSSRELDTLAPPPDWAVAVENLRVGARATTAYMEGDYQAALDHLDSLESPIPQEKYALFTSRSWEVFLRGLVLARLGRGREALPWFQQQPNEFGFALVAPAHLERARIYDALGDTEQAVEYYTRFIDLWRDADPGPQARVEEARTRLAALSS